MATAPVMDGFETVGQARVLGRYEDGSPEWFDARRQGIGGSDVAAILGLSKWSTPYLTWLDKVGLAEDDESSIPARVGSALEPLICELFREHTGLNSVDCNALLQHPTHEYLLANLDNLVGSSIESGEAVLECKSVGWRSRDDWANGVPLYYLTQCQQYMGVTGLDYAYVAVLFGKENFDLFRVERDEEDFAAIQEACGEFWNKYVIPQEPPPLEGHSDVRRYLASKYAEDNGETVKLDTDEALPFFEKYERAKELIDEGEKLKEEAQVHLMDMIGEAKRAEIDTGHKATFVRSRYFKEEIAREKYPEVVEEFTLPSLDAKALKAARRDVYNDCRKVTSGHLLIRSPKED